MNLRNVIEDAKISFFLHFIYFWFFRAFMYFLMFAVHIFGDAGFSPEPERPEGTVYRAHLLFRGRHNG